MGDKIVSVNDEATPLWDASAVVRQKILATMKRGIADKRGRKDLAEGELRMLEHMQLYVMETNVAESQLSDDDKTMWEAMKADYLLAQKTKQPQQVQQQQQQRQQGGGAE